MHSDPIAGPSRSPAFSVALTVALGASLGLLLGLLGGLLMVAKDLLLPRLVLYNPHVLWMAPLAHALWAVPAAFLLGVSHRVWPRVFTPRLIVFLLLASGCYAVLRVYGGELEKWAAAVLSAGVAYRAARWRGLTEAGRVRVLLRRSAVPLVAVVCGVAGVVLAAPRVREELRLLGRAEAAQGAPNVLLVILDTVRAMSMSLYGHERPTTPRIADLAGRGVTFDLAIAPAPWTLPTHASIFTGRYPHELSATWRVPLDGTHATLAEVMTAAGYRAGAVVGNTFNASSAMGLGRGFDRYIDDTASWADFIRASYFGRLVLNEIRSRWFDRDFEFADFTGRRTAREVSRDLLRWIDAGDDRPFFAFVNYFDAHDEYAAPDSFEAAIASVPLRDPPPVRVLERGELVAAGPARARAARRSLDLYEAALAYLDAEVGRLLDQLERRGLLENTLLIVTSDHGEEFGEHGLFWHAHSLYLPSLHVPLVLVWSGRVPAGRRVQQAVTLRDIAATVVSLAGVASSAGDGAQRAGELPGSSLERYWRVSREPAAPAPAVSILDLDLDGVERWPGSRRLESVVVDGMHYIRNEAGPEELYDLVADAVESDDLAGSLSGRLERYRRLLLAAGAPLTTGAMRTAEAGIR